MEQLPIPIILMGDFNAHSKMWGVQWHQPNWKNPLIYAGIAQTVLNDKTHSYLHPSPWTSAIDLILCSPLIFMDFHWESTMINVAETTLYFPNQRILHQRKQIQNGKSMKLIGSNLTNSAQHWLMKEYPINQTNVSLHQHPNQNSKTIPYSSIKPHPKTNPWKSIWYDMAVRNPKRPLQNQN